MEGCLTTSKKLCTVCHILCHFDSKFSTFRALVSGLSIFFSKNLLDIKNLYYWFVIREYGHLTLYVHIFWSNRNNIKFTIQSIQLSEICIFTTLCNHFYSHSKTVWSFSKKTLYSLISDSSFSSALVPWKLLCLDSLYKWKNIYLNSFIYHACKIHDFGFL